MSEIISKTDWVIGHAHIALLGAFTYFSIAGVYGVLPVLTGKPLWSQKLAKWHFSLTLFGSMLMFLSLHIGGFWQGLQWAHWADGATYLDFQRHLSQNTFLQTVASMRPWWVLRGLSGAALTTASAIFAVNVFNTILLEETDV